MFSVNSIVTVNAMENMTVFSQRFNYLIIYVRKHMGRDSSVNEMKWNDRAPVRGYQGPLPGSKATGLWGDHLRRLTPRLGMHENLPHCPLYYASWRGKLHLTFMNVRMLMKYLRTYLCLCFCRVYISMFFGFSFIKLVCEHVFVFWVFVH
jgi:hypothetical protein